MESCKGGVGVGTTSPSAKLHVGCTAGTDGIMFPDGTLQKTAANGGGAVSSIATGSGLTGGTITTSGTLALATSGVTAGTYSRATVSVDSYGRLVSASSGPAIVDADISATAAIAESKIAGLTADLKLVKLVPYTAFLWHSGNRGTELRIKSAVTCRNPIFRQLSLESASFCH